MDRSEDTLNHGNIPPHTVFSGFSIALVGEKKCEKLQIRLIPQSLLCNMLFSVPTEFRYKDFNVPESLISFVTTLKSCVMHVVPHECQRNIIPLTINRIVKKDKGQK